MKIEFQSLRRAREIAVIGEVIALIGAWTLPLGGIIPLAVGSLIAAEGINRSSRKYNSLKDATQGVSPLNIGGDDYDGSNSD